MTGQDDKRRRRGAGLSMRPKNSDGPLYSPQRDLAYLFPFILQRATKQLEAGSWEDAMELTRRCGASTEDLVEAAIKLVAWSNAIADDPDEDCMDVLQRVGWFDVHFAARWFFQGIIGAITIATAYDSILDVTFDGNLSKHITSLLEDADFYRRMFSGDKVG